MLFKLDKLEKSNDILEKNTKQYIVHINQLCDYIDDLRARNDEETRLRKQFEAKLNAIHSIARDQEVKYQRALEDIDNIDKQKKTLTSQCNELRELNL